MKYKLSDLASLAEILGGVAIIISLIFVGIQLQENTRSTKAASAIAASTATADWYIALSSNENSSALFRNFMVNPDDLSPDQRFQAVMITHALMIIHQNNYYLATEGTLDSQMKNAISQSIVVVKDQLGWKYYWKNRRQMFFKDFQDYVDSLMRMEQSFSGEIYIQLGADQKPANQKVN